MRNSLLAAVAILGLSACDRSPDVDEKNATPAEVANAVSKAGIANDIYLRAGEWRVVSRIEHMNLPGLPPSEQSKMKERGNSTHQYCLTPEEAKRPGGKFFDSQAEKNCRYEHFSMGGGKIDAVMRCGAPAGAFMMTIAGTYSKDSYSTQVAMDMEGGREGKMTMKMRSEAHASANAPLKTKHGQKSNRKPGAELQMAIMGGKEIPTDHPQCREAFAASAATA